MSRAAIQSLYTADGTRKYINIAERTALLSQLDSIPRDRALFIRTLALTGGRVSEILELTPNRFQLKEGIVAIRTLKRRAVIFREIPLPKGFIAELDQHFSLRAKQESPNTAIEHLWRFNRVTAWTFVKSICQQVGISGVRATPRGLRHGFGRMTLDAGVPLDTLQRLLGHASIETTTIYTQACGPDERVLVTKFWRYADEVSEAKL